MNVLQVHFRLDLLPQIIIRNQLICLVPQGEHAWRVFYPEIDTQLPDYIVHSKGHVNTNSDGHALLGCDRISGDET